MTHVKPYGCIIAFTDDADTTRLELIVDKLASRAEIKEAFQNILDDHTPRTEPDEQVKRVLALIIEGKRLSEAILQVAGFRDENLRQRVMYAKRRLDGRYEGVANA